MLAGARGLLFSKSRDRMSRMSASSHGPALRPLTPGPVCLLAGKSCAPGSPTGDVSPPDEAGGGPSVLAESALLCAERNLWKLAEKYLLCDFLKKEGRKGGGINE